MKYWLFGAANTDYDSLRLYGPHFFDYKMGMVTFVAEDEDSFLGNVVDDYLVSGSGGEKVVSCRVANAIEDLELEGVEVWSFTAKLPDRIYTDTWKYIRIANYVDCIDFQHSEIDYDEETGTIDFIDKLLIDEKKADLAGYHIFRLHERSTKVVVSDVVKQAIEAINPVGIDFDPTDGSYIKE